MKTKKKSGKRFLSWLLAAVMIIALMPATAFAEPPTESSGNTEPAVTSYCPEPEGDTDVSVGGYDSSPAAETKDTPTEEPAKDTPTAEPAKDTPTAEPAKDTPTAEPVKESPVADKTTEGTPAQKGAVENSTDEKITEDLTNEVSPAELAGLTAMLGAPVPMEIYAWQSYHVYVYGCFKHKGNNLDPNAALYINGKETAIEWNGDASKGEYYITFGKLENATTEKPSRYKNNNEVPEWQIPTNNIKSRIAKGEVILAAKDIAGSAQKNGLATTGEDVNKYVKGNWSGLKPRKGAEGFPETKTNWSWHIDGTIDVYRVYYTRGDLPENEDFTPPKESTYFLDDYIVRGQKPTSKNYKFTGWAYNGVTYNQGDKVPASKTDITLEAQWAPKEKVYTVNYEWGNDAPESVTLPTDSTKYKEKDTALNSYTEHPFTTIKADNGTYTFSGWKATEGTTDYSGDEIVTPITFTGTWTFTPKPVTKYKVVYNWGGGDDVPGDVTLPRNDNSYESESEAIGAMDTNYTNSSTSTTKKGDKEGLWTFSGWTPSDPVVSATEENTEVITFTGRWTFTEKVVKVTYNWGNDVPSDVVSRKPADKTYNSVDAAKADMDKTFTSTSTSNAPNGNIAGSWTFSGWTETKTTSDDGNKILIALTGIWNFTPSETKTITDVLKGLVWKKFESQYGYSTEGTFTATAKVMSYQLEISSYTAEGDEPSDNNTNTPGTDNTKTFTGTVNLKTGDTKQPFTFSADKGVADVLEPRTHYEVWISEDKGTLSKVTYDTTKYILEFTTGANSEVLPNSIHIWTGEDIAEGEEGKEPTPVEGTTITFKNIYTYKRHHSSGDSGNGGGKKEEKPTVEIKDDDALGLNNTDHFAYIVGYGNGEVRPQNSITRAEVAAIFFRLLEDDVRDANYTRQNKFTDVSNDAWYCSAVSTLSAMGIISGYPDATFRPNASITRAEFAAIATRFDVNGDKTPASFNDIADHWAKDEIAVAANNGWVNGYEDGSFRPQNKITRAETMSLVNRVLNRKPETAEDLLENMAKWTDNADTNAWYYLAVQEATNSHYYEYKENSQYEKWTELRETRDWSELDK